MFEGETAIPWKPWYETCNGMVVLAETEAEARRHANEHGGYENERAGDVRPWLDAKFTTCESVDMAGSSGVILDSILEA